MSKLWFLMPVTLVCCLSGCSLHDFAFDLFENAYSGGGTTRDEKKLDYDTQLKSWDGYNP